MMTVSITEFMAEQLDKDEAAARAVLANTEGRPFEQGRYEQWAEVNDTVLGDQAGHVIAYGVASYALPHIARHDPARVLREVAAKRAILAEIVSAMNGMDLQIHSEWGVGSLDPADYESVALLRLLAAPYSDHPDYNPDWSIT